jgi:hypothetical protein
VQTFRKSSCKSPLALRAPVLSRGRRKRRSSTDYGWMGRRFRSRPIGGSTGYWTEKLWPPGFVSMVGKSTESVVARPGVDGADAAMERCLRLRAD